jgi:hypothetical protein
MPALNRHTGRAAVWVQNSGRLQCGARPGSAAEWLTHVPSPAIAEVSAAAEAARKADADLAAAVRRAHDAGESWAAIGTAAGMSRQAANQRWGKLPLAATGDSPDETTGGSPADSPD